MKELQFDIHGLVMKLRTEDEGFSEFVAENYSIFATPSEKSPDVVVNFSREAMESAKRKSSELSHVGNHVFVSDNSIYWTNEFGFHILVEHRPSGIEVSAHHQELLDGQKVGERYKNYQRCMRWALHYPLFTLLQYRRGWGILHGAAVSNGRRTMAFCGLNKMGKSTLATHLCREQDYDLLTDNYLLYDGDRIYAFPEVLRLGERSTNRFGVDPLWDHKIYDKYHISPEELGTRREATVNAFFILSQNNNICVRSIEPKKAWQTMGNLHSMLAEFPQHGYMAVWPLVSGMTRDYIDEQDPLYQTPWYSLTYEPDWDIERVIEEVERCI